MARVRTSAGTLQDRAERPSQTVGDHDDWFGSQDAADGQLAVDVYQTPDAIVIKSPIAGVTSDDLDIAVQRDVITIRGARRQSAPVPESEYLFQECYWGNFSRSIILPTEVQVDRVTATLQHGILTVTLPKTRSSAVRVVPVRADT